MKKISSNYLSTLAVNQHIYALVRKDEKLTLQILNEDLEVLDEIISVRGRTGFILKVEGSKALVSVDDKLYLVKDSGAEIVLTAGRPGNIFWHSAKAEGRVFIHEYGEPPCSIFMSKDLKSWERVVTNLNIDKSSKHFHYIAYDPYRKWLISTLGDGCLTRVVISEDLGSSWRPLYKGPWQFVPVVILEDKLVFGMDSGIVKGGVGIFDPLNYKWDFVFLKWRGQDVRLAQMSDLRLLNNGVWIAALGTPQAIVVSKTLKAWHAVYVEGFDKQFNHNMTITEGRDFAVFSTGKSLLLFRKSELEGTLNVQPVMVSYKAYMDRLWGCGFVLKRRILRIL